MAAEPSPNADIEALSYEEAREQLVGVVGKLEAGGASLEESLALWERGEALAKRCEEWLEGARKRLAAARDQPPDRLGDRPGQPQRRPLRYRSRSHQFAFHVDVELRHSATAAPGLRGRPAAAAARRCGHTTSCSPAPRTTGAASVLVLSKASW